LKKIVHGRSEKKRGAIKMGEETDDASVGRGRAKMALTFKG